jgi:hypothetical protein
MSSSAIRYLRRNDRVALLIEPGTCLYRFTLVPLNKSNAGVS